MPRLAMTKEQKMAARVATKQERFTAWFLGRLKKGDISQQEAGKWLGITQQGISRKARANAFTLKDMLIIFHMLDADAEELSQIFIWED